MKIRILFAAAAAFFSSQILYAHMDTPSPTWALSTSVPQDILGGIYQPWSGPLAEVERTLKPNRNYAVWINVPATHPMDLRSSDHFRQWVLGTGFENINISHNLVAFRCHAGGNRWVTGVTGLTGENNKQETKMFTKGYGLSVFFSTFTDGHLNTEREASDYISYNLDKRGVVFAAYEISSDQCSSMLTFLTQFVYAPNRPYERFGLLLDPDKLEGGGCVTFASALLKSANLLEPVIPHFYRNIEASQSLFGGNLPSVIHTEPANTPWLGSLPWYVPLDRLLTTNWNRPQLPFLGMVSLRLMDPEKMLYSLKQFANVYLEQAPESVREEDNAWLAQSTLKTRTVHSADTIIGPLPPYRYFDTKIDDNFDSEIREVKEAALTYYREKLRSGWQMRLEKVAGQPVLLLERP